jgi:glycosyltransferase involved in cell wall biosynthesis
MDTRSLFGLADLPTIVATGPFDDRAHAEHLATAFTAVQQVCRTQLVLLGTGAQRGIVMRRAAMDGVDTWLHLIEHCPGHRWANLLTAADVVVPSTASGARGLLEVMAAGCAVVALANPATVRLLVPNSAGFVYRPEDVSGLVGSLLRLLTKPTLRYGMATRASEVARRRQLKHTKRNPSDEGSEYE